MVSTIEFKKVLNNEKPAKKTSVRSTNVGAIMKNLLEGADRGSVVCGLGASDQ